MKYKIAKYHGLGNDYIMVDPNIHEDIKLTDRNIKLLCDHHYGVGSDGILYGPFFDNDKITVKIYNPDGSEAEKSGNGIRIFAKYLLDANYVNSQTVTLNTLGGPVEIEYADKQGQIIKVGMGKSSFMSDIIPVTGPKREVINAVMDFDGVNYNIGCVSVGNPHCVIIMKEISSNYAKYLGPIVENDKRFPKRINMQLMKVIDRKNIQIEIYERGVGYTLASGTSSCAAASVAYKLGLTEPKVMVHMPGGMLEIEIGPDDKIYMTGPVSSIGEMTLSDELSEELKGKQYIKRK